MQPEEFLIVIAAGILLVILSLALDRLWAATMPVPEIYYIIRAPGIVLHECSHILGCIVTGAKVRNVVFFSKEGGLVTYTSPAIPVLGDVIISAAPVFCIPLILAGITWAFAAYLGCVFVPFPASILSAASAYQAGTGIASTLYQNIVAIHNGWFLVYIYLTISLVLSVAPSFQDLRNAAIGIILLLALGIAIIAFNVPYAGTALAWFCSVLGAGFSLGLAFGLIALICSIPLIAWHLYRSLR